MKYLLMCVLCLCVAGCGSEFVGGVVAGAAAATELAKVETVKTHENIERMKVANAELEEAEGTLGLLSVLDPNVKANLDKTIANIEAIKATAKDIEDSVDDVDLTTLLIGLLGMFSGGTATNMAKNRWAK